MRISFLLIFFLICLIGFSSKPPVESLTVHKLFTTGAVLQRDIPVPVWGTAPAGTMVTISLNQEEQSVQATDDGNWLAILAPHTAGGPHRLMITTGTDTLIAGDVLFGDVWIASGQSNMEWSVINSADAEREIASANDSFIRHYKVPRSWSYTPLDTLAGGEWHPALPEYVSAFTAVGYSFARDLRTAIDIPIGILNTSWGGSRIEAWMDPLALGMNESQIARMLGDQKAHTDSLVHSLATEHGASADMDPGFEANMPIWADPDLDDSDWMKIQAPGTWEASGLEGLNGVVWYRTRFNLDSAPTEAVLHLGIVDDQDMTWINGQLVGETNEYQVERAYPVPEGLLRPGDNQITVRVQDIWGNGGLVAGDSKLALRWSDGEVNLEGMWNIRVGQFQVEPSGPPNHQPSLLYNAMIHPILNFPVTGYIWYQGESNANDPEAATAYAAQFQSLITRWRDLWGGEQSPFLFVSLASFQPDQEQPHESDWAVLRESQSSALSLPNTGQAITLDIGDADDIHPKNKQDVGKRLARWAKALAYGDQLIVPSGPIYRDHVIKNGMVYLRFDHVGGGLMARDNPLGGFAIAGPEGGFVWAEARIQGDSVVVSHPDIPNPAAVRYAWADNPSTANLINAEGLPAASFRIGR